MNETISTALGTRVRRIRHERGLTLKQIEAKVGVSATHISEIERGNTSPTIGALDRIAGALGVLPSYLIDIPAMPEIRVQHPEERKALQMGQGIVTLDPLTDVRGSAWYRRQMIRVFVGRALKEVRDGNR